MELDAIDTLVPECCNRRPCCVCEDINIRGQAPDQIPVRHPDSCFFLDSVEEIRSVIHREFSLPVFPHPGVFGLPAHIACDQLGTVADSKYRNPKLEYFGVAYRGVLCIHAGWTSRQDDRARIHILNRFRRGGVRDQLGVYLKIPAPPHDQVAILPAKIHDCYELLLHVKTSSICIPIIRSIV